MEIYLIRHAEPQWVIDGVNIVDPHLSERGTRQAEALAEALDGVHFDEILASPLRRTHLTAEPMLRRRHARLAVAPWLEEIREPNWHGLPATLAADAYANERRMIAEDRWKGLPGGEAPRDFVVRIADGCEQFLIERGIVRSPQPLPVWTMEPNDRRIALFAHAGTNGVVLCHLLGLDAVPWEWDRMATGHASISVLTSMEIGDGHTFMLSSLSNVEHLAKSDRTR